MIDFKFLYGIKTVAIVCTQWGDTGKGKFVDLLASEWADIIARGTGGANAGHTIVKGDKEIVFHLLPSGMLTSKLNIIGSGVAVEPGLIVSELDALKHFGGRGDNLRISMNARLVMPQHIALDRVRESTRGAGKIGTTGRGMGPVYEDHVARLGLVVNDLLNPDVLAKKLRRNVDEKIRVLRTYDPEIVREVMRQPILGNGNFYKDSAIFDIDSIIAAYRVYGTFLSEFIDDTDRLLQNALGRRRILLEGAQGNLLSVDYGTYPFVTASDCSVHGLAKGVGLCERDVEITLGIVKAFYMTRVGEGPFPTELGGEQSAIHCRTATKMSEAEIPGVSINHPSEFVQGIAIRQQGNEYGATTARPRRTGWLDLPLVRYSAQHLGCRNVILTKLDVLDRIQSIKICTSYMYEGPDYILGRKTFQAGTIIETAIPDVEIMRYCRPQYAELAGWVEPIHTLRLYDQLPQALQSNIRFIREQTNVNIVLLSVGPRSEETIFVAQPIF